MGKEDQFPIWRWTKKEIDEPAMMQRSKKIIPDSLSVKELFLRILLLRSSVTIIFSLYFFYIQQKLSDLEIWELGFGTLVYF